MMRPRGSTYALIASLVLFVPALSGCLVAQATAMEHQDDAEDIARDWDADARLLHIMGMEGRGDMANGMGGWEGDASGAEVWTRTEQDDEVGDGHAEVWAYHFRNGAGTEDLFVMLDRDGKEIQRETAEPEDDAEPIGDYDVDSDEALDKAKAASKGLRDGTDSDHYGIVMVLGRDSGFGANPAWLIMGGGGGDGSGAGDGSGGGGMVAIDAKTGEVLAQFDGSAMGGMDGWDDERH